MSVEEPYDVLEVELVEGQIERVEVVSVDHLRAALVVNEASS
ncbi:hypothetical protein [Nocardioides sp. InS609-2]|nr:hypothetical protein [Nocardioides sp. InS609-2]